MAVTFDLPNGQVRVGAPDQARAHDEVDTGRSVIVPAEALAALAAAAGVDPSRELGRSLGRTLGARLRARVGESIGAATVDAIVTELAGELALVGLGTLALERWGRALVVQVLGAPFAEDDASDALLVGTVEAMVSEATGREVRGVRLARDGRLLRVLLARPATAERVETWLSEGVAWGDAITRLHAPKSDEEARA